MISPFRGFNAVFYKEVLHMRRDPITIMFALVVPLLQMAILGGAIDTNVRQVKTVVFDESADQMSDANLAGSQDRRAFLDRLRNSDTYRIYKYVHSDAELTEEMVAGRARVGIKFPWDFDSRLQKHETAQVMVMVDGSDSSVAAQTLNVATALGLDESLKRIIPPGTKIPIEVRPKMMFNPDSRSPNFFLPGLAAILLLMATTMLTAFSIVREKERGTLEQLFVTPVRPLGMMMGKLMPYFFFALFELCVILSFMRFIFQVPIHGSVLLLISLSTCYLFVHLAIGLMISTKANSQAEAMQSAMMTMLPSIFLSGYIFPRDNMPLPFYALSFCLPATYMIDIARGVILRGAGLAELWSDALVLFGMGLLVLMIAARRFKKMIL